MREVKNLKTLHISRLPIWDLGQGKGRVSTYLSLKTMCNRGYKVWFLCSDKSLKIGRINDIDIKKLKNILPRLNKESWGATLFSLLNLPFLILQCLLIGLRFKPDVIYAHDIYSSVLAFILSRLFGSRYMLRLYGTGFESNSINKKVKYTALKLSADLYIITNDGTSGKSVAEKYVVSQHKICFWVNGVDKNWAYEPIDYELKRELSPDNEKKVLSLCRLVDSKQVDIIIKAVPKVIEKYRNVKFIIVGDGRERGNLERLAESLGVSDFVRFEGAIEHSRAIQYIKICDIFVSMNGLSSICNPVLEAMTCGKAVIALNTGETEDLIKNHFNGILISNNETDKLSDYILYALKNDNIRQMIGENAQKFMLENWPSWEQRANLEVDLVEALCSNDPEKLINTKRKADSFLDLSFIATKECK